MSILIKGIEMPKEGNWRSIRIYPDGTIGRPIGFGDYALVEGAEAVPVPPHGRLIDADALIDSFDPSDFWNPDAEDNCFAAIHVVNCAPTVIEAEEGE